MSFCVILHVCGCLSWYVWHINSLSYFSLVCVIIFYTIHLELEFSSPHISTCGYTFVLSSICLYILYLHMCLTISRVRRIRTWFPFMYQLWQLNEKYVLDVHPESPSICMVLQEKSGLCRQKKNTLIQPGL